MADDEWVAVVDVANRRDDPTEIVLSAPDELTARSKAERILPRLYRESSIDRVERVPVRAYERTRNGRAEGVRAHTRRQVVKGGAIPEPVFRPNRSTWNDVEWQHMVAHVGPEGSGTWVEGTWGKDGFRTDSLHPDVPSPTVAEIEAVYAGRGEGDSMQYHSPLMRADSPEFEEAVWAVGNYNAFDPKKVIAAAKKFPEGSLVSVGREYSPVLYVTVPDGYGMHYEMVEGALRKIRGGRPDELQTHSWGPESGIEGESVRAWWD